MASTVSKLDKRITEQLSYSPPPFVDSRTRFRITRSPYGLNQWEIRAYRFDAPEISPETLLNRLQENLDTPLSNLEKRQDVEEITWPLWLRGFRNDAFFDIKFYNPKKFLVSVTVRDSRVVDRVQLAILDAVAVCQDYS
jgi:hypothetical protein